jgi:hypothetical protein
LNTTLARIVPRLNEAARLAELEQLPTAGGWSADLWTFGPAATAELIAGYLALLEAATDDKVIATLAAQGVSINHLLHEPTVGDRPMVTRSDLSELAAAATIIGGDGYDPDHLYMSNVPKGSRRRSEVGIDLVYVALNPDGPDMLGDDEGVHMTSVKHTLDGPVGALRRQVVESLPESETCTIQYVGTQLRVLEARIAERHPHINAQRIFLSILGLRHPPYTYRTGVPVVDTKRRREMADEGAHLPPVDTNRHHFRVIALDDLAELHAQCL